MSNENLKKLVSDLTQTGKSPERKGVTIYLAKDLFEELEGIRGEYDMTRQDLLSRLIDIGFEAFKAEVAKKSGKRTRSDG